MRGWFDDNEEHSRVAKLASERRAIPGVSQRWKSKILVSMDQRELNKVHREKIRGAVTDYVYLNCKHFKSITGGLISCPMGTDVNPLSCRGCRLSPKKIIGKIGRHKDLPYGKPI